MSAIISAWNLRQKNASHESGLSLFFAVIAALIAVLGLSPIGREWIVQLPANDADIKRIVPYLAASAAAG